MAIIYHQPTLQGEEKLCYATYFGASSTFKNIITSIASRQLLFVVIVVHLTLLTDPLRIQPWSQDRRNQTKSNRKSEISRESRQKRTDRKVASKEHYCDQIENTNKNTQTVESNQMQPHKNAGKVAL